MSEQQKQAAEKAPKKEQVNEEMYERYVQLKFIRLAGDELQQDAQKELDKLEEKIKACSGKKAKQTTTRQLGVKLVRLVEGMPVPDSLYEHVAATARDVSKYF